jgi:hypothetical protein
LIKYFSSGKLIILDYFVSYILKHTMPKRKKSQKGKGIMSDIHSFVKDNKLISKGLGLLNFPGSGIASKGAAMLGYGRKKKRKRSRRLVGPLLTPLPGTTRLHPSRAVGKVMMGRGHALHGAGIFSDLGGGIGSIFGGLGHGLFGGAAARNVVKTN